MAFALPLRVSRPFDFRLALGIPIFLMGLMLLLDPTALDLSLIHI